MARRGVAPARGRRAGARSRRDMLLDEAARQLNARGVSLTSLTQLAEELGVSRAALYHYVDDREDLVFQVYRRSCEILGRHLGEAARSGRRALEVVCAFVASVLDPAEAEIAALSEIGLLRTAERETVLGIYEGVVARLSSVLKAGVRAGEVRDCDCEVAARSIISMIYWIQLAGRWTIAAVDVDRRRLIGLINEVLCFGTAVDRRAVVDPPRIDLSPLVTPTVPVFDRGALTEAKRETILAAASRLFNAKGVDTTSLDEIAAELGATKAVLYRYVGDKQAIVSACYERAYRIYYFPMDRAHDMGMGPADAMVAVARAQAVSQQRRDISPLRPLGGFDALGAEERAAAEGRSRELSARSLARLTEAQRVGVMRPIDLRLMQWIGPGPTIWLVRDPVASDPARQDHIADQIAELMRVGLAPLDASVDDAADRDP